MADGHPAAASLPVPREAGGFAGLPTRASGVRPHVAQTWRPCLWWPAGSLRADDATTHHRP